MKKILLGVLTCLLIACVSLSVACSNKVSFKKPTLVEKGALVQDGGLLAETENYVYVINGIGTSTDDNTFGAPVKGSLVAIKKDSLSAEATVSEVIVPKLFTSTDYTAGVFFSGDYVYYGSPCTDKNSSGDIANDKMTFMRTKLDGTQEKSDVYLTVSALSVKYRMTESDGVVYIVYQDTEDSSIKVYNTSTKETPITVVKTDDKNNTPIAEGASEYLSLDTVTFTGANDRNACPLVYTAKIYSEQYYEAAAEQSEYSRKTAKYNRLYALNAKGEAVCVLDGANNNLNLTYTVKLVSGGYIFYTAKDANSVETTYALEIAKIFAEDKGIKKIDNATYVADGTIINSLTEIYYLDALKTETNSETGEETTTGTGNLVKTTLIGSEKTVKQTVVLGSKASKLLAVRNGFVYYYNSNNEIARIELNNQDAKEQRVSAGSVNTSWYAPEFVAANQKDYIFYCDTTTVGSSYVWYTDLTATVIEEDSDDDGENDLFYLDADRCAGVMTDKDKANETVAAINAIPSVLEWTANAEGKMIVQSVIDADALYASLSEEIKEGLDETVVTKLENAKKAVSLGEKYYALKSVTTYDRMTEEQKATLKADYEAAKAARQALIDEVGAETFPTVRDMLSEEIKYYFQEAGKKFTTSENK